MSSATTPTAVGTSHARFLVGASAPDGSTTGWAAVLDGAGGRVAVGGAGAFAGGGRERARVVAGGGRGRS